MTGRMPATITILINGLDGLVIDLGQSRRSGNICEGSIVGLIFKVPDDKCPRVLIPHLVRANIGGIAFIYCGLEC
jgi:hypothetical protein